MIGRPLGMHYNHYVCPSVRPLAVSGNAHNSLTQWYTLIIFCMHIHVNIPETLAYKSTFLMDEGLLSINPTCCGQLVKMLITLEPYGIF